MANYRECTNKKVLVIGSGYIALEWVKALLMHNCQVTVMARNSESSLELKNKFNKIELINFQYDNLKHSYFDYIVVAVSITSTFKVLECIIENTVSDQLIFVEKPGTDLEAGWPNSNLKYSSLLNCRVVYNRRFMPSWIYFRNYIAGLSSIEGMSISVGISEDFSNIDSNKFTNSERKNWVLANTIHIIDLILITFEHLGCDDLLSQLDKKIIWGKSNRFFINCERSGEQTNVELVIEANASSPGWYIIAENKIDNEICSLKPLEVCNIENKTERITCKSIGDHVKPGYNNIILEIAKGNLEKFPKIEDNIQKLKSINERFGYER